jgi:hypothetical protein
MPPGFVAPARAPRFDLNAFTAGKYATPDDVIHAIFPDGAPAQRMQVIQQQQRQADDARVQELLSTKFDRSTLGGAIGAFMQAMQKKDAVGMADFFFADGDTDGRYARAFAVRVVAATDLEEAITNHVDKESGEAIVGGFGLSPGMAVAPEWLAKMDEAGDRAVGSFDGGNKQTLKFRKVDGIWKEDLTPPASQSATEVAAEMDEDNHTMDRIMIDITAGKYTTLPQVRDALGAAMLNATPDVMFSMQNFRVRQDEQPIAPARPPTTQPFVTDRKTPAGAMNSFVVALANADAATLADSYQAPQDKDASCRRATALELIAGMQLFHAAEKRFGESWANGIGFEGGLSGANLQEGFTDDQWVVTRDYPNMAFRNM